MVWHLWGLGGLVPPQVVVYAVLMLLKSLASSSIRAWARLMAFCARADSLPQIIWSSGSSSFSRALCVLRVSSVRLLSCSSCCIILLLTVFACAMFFPFGCGTRD